MKKILLAAAAAGLAVPAAPAFAADISAPVSSSAFAGAYTVGFDDDDDDKRWKRGRGHYRQNQHRANQRRYYTSGNGIQYWRGDDGRYHCKRSNGTTGLIVGAAAGALAGRAIDTRGERATGTILGAAAGALLGREIQRGQVRCR